MYLYSLGGTAYFADWKHAHPNNKYSRFWTKHISGDAGNCVRQCDVFVGRLHFDVLCSPPVKSSRATAKHR
eukprot:2522539-Pyramimonas_sp.AAC.1